MDANGNLVVNGQPYLPIQGTNLDYMTFGGGGYTVAQTDAKLTQMTQWGFNTLFGNWNTLNPSDPSTPYQDALAWQRHGLYWHGSATLDDVYTPTGTMLDYWTAQGQATMAMIVARHMSQPNLLLWWIADEWQAFTGYATTTYCSGSSAVLADDRAHPWGDTLVNASDGWTPILGTLVPNAPSPPCMPVAFYEYTFSYGSAGEALGHLVDAMAVMNQGALASRPYVLGISTTPIQEIDQSATQGLPRAPSQAEIHRAFMYQVANNARAFDVLWAVNQGLTGGDAQLASLPTPGASPSYLDVWNSTGIAIQRVKSLAPVILAPGRWIPLSVTPGFQGGLGPTGNSMTGVFAAAKTVGGVTYVIATNMSEYETPNPADFWAPGTWTDQAVPSATINLGIPIRSVTRLFETGSPSFSGTVITDSFAPLGVHVYVVQ